MQSNAFRGSCRFRDARGRARKLVLAMVGLIAVAVGPVHGQSLVLDRTIDLPSVQGRIDHLAVDVEGERLFVAALASNSVEIVDLHASKRIDRIAGLHEPQGVLFLANGKRLLIANGSGGGVQAFADGKGPAVASRPELDDADNLRLDASTGEVIVGFGRALAVLDPDTLRVLRRIDLEGHPESFQIDRSGKRIYVNVPGAGHVAVIDRARDKIVATWRLEGAARNFAMALDESGHRLFVATRSPARLIAFDTDSGRQVNQVPVCGDADDLFLDEATKRLYVVCGEGEIDVLRSADARLAVVERLPTAPGARTGLFVPRLSTLFVAVPARGGSRAEVRAYAVR